jgi:pantetheine-phosphate adenylyltransferase
MPTPQQTSPRIAVFPGSFDPLTSGHVDIIERARYIFDQIIVAVLINRDKLPLFTIDERVTMIREVFREHADVEVDTFDGLLVDYARKHGAHAIIRGLRAVSDFEYEFQMALMNRRLNKDLETVFLMPAEKYTYTSSRLIKEVFMLGGEVGGLVPRVVEDRLRQKQASRRPPLAGSRKA